VRAFGVDKLGEVQFGEWELAFDLSPTSSESPFLASISFPLQPTTFPLSLPQCWPPAGSLRVLEEEVDSRKR